MLKLDVVSYRALEVLSSQPEVLAHSIRVANRARLMALHLGLPSAGLYWLAGIAHDFGKLEWPKELHVKIGLNGSDWNIIRQHPVRSLDIFQREIGTDALQARVLVDCILHHHERPGGGGYPDNMEPSVSALILGIADAWDALLDSRPYRKEPFSESQAIYEIQRWAPAKLLDILISANKGGSLAFA